jgi:transposase
MGHRKITAKVKAEAVRLVVKKQISAPQAAQMMGVGPTALRRWVAEQRAIDEAPPPDPKKVALDQALIVQLRARLAAAEKERDLLKKSLPSHLVTLYQQLKRSTK